MINFLKKDRKKIIKHIYTIHFLSLIIVLAIMLYSTCILRFDVAIMIVPLFAFVILNCYRMINDICEKEKK